MNTEPSPIFMLDTNILINWIYAYLQNDTAKENIRLFCENTPHTVVIPDIVWLEAVSVFVHKNIRLGDTLEETNRNFRDNQTIVLQLQQLILKRPNWVLGWHPKNSSCFQEAVTLMMEKNLLTQQIFSWMQKRAAKNYLKDSPKLLDGIDSAIFCYLNALGKENPEKKVVLYTSDYPLYLITKSAPRECNWIVSNLFGIFAYFPTIYCAKCHYQNPASILHTSDMSCQKPIGSKHRIF